MSERRFGARLRLPPAESPDYSDNFVRVNERLNAAMRHHVETERPRELNRIADEVFAKYGITDPNMPIADTELVKKIDWEIRQRFALHALNLPYVENMTGQEIVTRLKEALPKVG